ncbi:MAG: cytochrome c oxidase subunit 3 [Abditibacteriales bacterium]|nr:cytochrome c oxidase subunit 3 [Abditibacteriales bacterium]MDW8366643.1 cytochrome c oxidase subunit 3 [Abditibacteriales bacterium]
MMSQPLETKTRTVKPTNGSGQNGGWGGDGDPWRGGNEFPIPTGKIGLWLLLAAIVIMFAGFTSAYIVRSGAEDWRPLVMPTILWFNSAVLVLSSLTMHLSLMSVRSRWGQDGKLMLWLSLTVLLGIVFLGGQWTAWRQLVQQGVYLHTNPASSFFYLLTAMHGIHLIGGLAFLIYVLAHAARHRYTPKQHLPVELCATYWHFLDGLWLYLFVFLFIIHPG